MGFKFNFIILFYFSHVIYYSNAEVQRFFLGDKRVTIRNDDTITEAKIEKIDSNFEYIIVAQLVLKASLNFTGWNHVEVWGNPHQPDSLVAYESGVLEGMATAQFIYQHWYNTRNFFCVDQTDICTKINDFVAKNNDYIKKRVKAESHTSTYWYQVYLYYEQIKGIAKGYEKIRESIGLPSITLNEILLMNFEGDLFDLLDKFKNSGQPRKLFAEGHCTAIIKLLPNYKDLYVAHNSWFKYFGMHRMLKKYILRYRELPHSDTRRIPGHEITFSGYPAKLNSFDDFYLLSSHLAVIETTIGNSNNDLWKYIQPNTVFESVRVMVANRLAKDGKSWTDIFKKYNSGTYNNQWMIIDYTKFKKGKSPKKGLLWILEQIPGHTEAADQTSILKKQSYWGSYNIPFYQNIFNLSGNNELVEKYGHWYSYTKAPRAEIIRRDHKKIKDFDSLLSFMRYNDYKNDEYSRCNCTPPYSASATISSRHDLNPSNGIYPIPMLGHRMGGAYDAKMTDSSLIKELRFLAVSGPSTGNNLPVFKWSTIESGDDIPHLGLPDEWNFQPILTTWILN